jgi:hypothetical protein
LSKCYRRSLGDKLIITHCKDFSIVSICKIISNSATNEPSYIF